MSSRRFVLPLDIADFKADTIALSPAQKGMYLSLMMHCFECGVLPMERIKLMRIAGCQDVRMWMQLHKPVMELFHLTGTNYRHKAMDAANDRISDLSSKRSQAAKKREHPASGSGNGVTEPVDNLREAPVEHVAVDHVPLKHVPQMAQPIDIVEAEASNCSLSKLKLKEVRESPKGASRGCAALDLRRHVFEIGPKIVSNLTGRMNGNARSFVSRLLKEAEDDCTVVLDILTQANADPPGDPSAWLIAAARHRAGHGRLSVHEQIRRDWNLGTFLTPVFDGPPTADNQRRLSA